MMICDGWEARCGADSSETPVPSDDDVGNRGFQEMVLTGPSSVRTTEPRVQATRDYLTVRRPRSWDQPCRGYEGVGGIAPCMD
jgi:hypothetical protein